MSRTAYLLRYLLIVLAASVIAMTGCDYSPELHAAVQARGHVLGQGAHAAAPARPAFLAVAGGR